MSRWKFPGTSSKPTPSTKKSEILELKEQLSDPNVDKDQKKKRELLQKVIGYVTMGVDTSKLFDNMILCVNTKDIVQKKMVYQYVTHHAHTNPELAIMVINTLQTDCRDESPLVRGLALRCLSSLRLPKVVEYLLPLIKEGLNDPSPYVRKTAVVACVKLNRISPSTVQSNQFVKRLYAMIRDKDIQVVTNAVMALNEILEEDGGIVVNKEMVYYLLNRLREFNEWHLCLILEILLKYTPGTKQEMYDIMNLLDPCLQIANSAVVMAITNVFLQFSNNATKSFQAKVFARLKDPLLLLLSTSAPELSYAILHHVKLMASRCPEVFTPHYRDFFIKHNEPTYMKGLKLETLTLVATDDNVKEIMEELSYYVTASDIDPETSRQAIRTLGEIAVKLSSATEVSITHLLDFLEMKVDYILAETFVVLKDILRKYDNEDFYKTFLPVITKHWRSVDDPKSTVAFLWILGEYGEIIDAAPYILETFIDSFTSYHHTIRLEILSSTMKLFFKRPPEIQKMLGRLFATAIQDDSHADVHDRALFYYRLLSTNVNAAKKVVCGKKVTIKNFTEEESAEYKDQLFAEFNTLAIPFNKPSERFIVKGTDILGENIEEESDDDEEEGEEEDASEEDEQIEKDEKPKNTQRGLQQTKQEGSQAKNTDGLLSFGQFEDPFGLKQNDKTEQTYRFTLKNKPDILDKMMYQKYWKSWTNSKQMQITISKLPSSAKEVDKYLTKNSILCLAFSDRDPMMFYFYAQEESGQYFLLKVDIFKQSRRINIQLKSETNNEKLWEGFQDLINKLFSVYI